MEEGAPIVFLMKKWTWIFFLLSHCNVITVEQPHNNSVHLTHQSYGTSDKGVVPPQKGGCSKEGVHRFISSPN